MNKRLKSLKQDLQYLEAVHKLEKRGIKFVNTENTNEVKQVVNALYVDSILTPGEEYNVEYSQVSSSTRSKLFRASMVNETTLSVLQRVRGQYKAEKSRLKSANVSAKSKKTQTHVLNDSNSPIDDLVSAAVNGANLALSKVLAV